MTPRCLLSFTAIALMAGCAPSDDPEPVSISDSGDDCPMLDDMPEGATLIPGRVDLDGEFHPLSDGNTLKRVYGPQGGTHVDLAARVFNELSEDHIIVVEVVDGPVSRLGVVGCDGWGQADFRVFDPGAELQLVLTLLDLDRQEQAVVELEMSITE